MCLGSELDVDPIFLEGTSVKLFFHQMNGGGNLGRKQTVTARICPGRPDALDQVCLIQLILPTEIHSYTHIFLPRDTFAVYTQSVATLSGRVLTRLLMQKNSFLAMPAM